MRPILTFFLACAAGVLAAALAFSLVPAPAEGALESASVHVAAPTPGHHAWGPAPLLALALVAAASCVVLALPGRRNP